MRALSFALCATFAFASTATAQNMTAETAADPAAVSAISGPIVVIDYTNPNLLPTHWTLTLRPDGSGHFHSENGTASTGAPTAMHAPDISRDMQVSRTFAAAVFQAAQRHSFFNQPCESHMKVAFQGNKTLSYSGPDGQGSCTFNYSRDREIEALGDNFMAVAETIMEGARLELLLQHDPLGLDKETANLVEAVQSGRAQQLCAIHSILERLAQDDHVLELVRKRARALLARADS